MASCPLWVPGGETSPRALSPCGPPDVGGALSCLGSLRSCRDLALGMCSVGPGPVLSVCGVRGQAGASLPGFSEA